MRDFSKVSPLLWGSQKFKGLTSESRLLYLYLLTCTHANAIGCYRLPLAYAAHDLGFDCVTHMQALIDASLVKYDEAESMVFVLQYIRFNAPMNINHARWMVKEARAVQNKEFSSDLLQLIQVVCQDKDWNGLATLFQPQSTVGERWGNGGGTGNTQDQTRPDPNQTKTQTAASVGSSAAQGVKGQKAGQPFNVLDLISDTAYDEAKRFAKGFDMHFLVGKYNDWVGEVGKPRISVNLAFPAWVKKFTEGQKA